MQHFIANKTFFFLICVSFDDLLTFPIKFEFAIIGGDTIMIDILD